MPNRDARAIAEGRFDAVAAHFAKVYAMRLPRHVTYTAAFFLGLDARERAAAWAFDAQALSGVGDWFEDGWIVDGALSKTAWADERCHGRFRHDPPELVTFVAGTSDGSHWGLWYDDPRELPRVCAHNWARDSAETGSCEPTLLASLLARFDRQDDPEVTRQAAGLVDWMRDLASLELAAHRAESIAPPWDRPDGCLGGMAPAGVAIPPDLLVLPAQSARATAHRGDPEAVRAMIARAREELERGAPGRALFLGRELHFFDRDEHREACTWLLVDAYRALGRDALAEVVRAHHGARDMRTVDAYVPSSSPFQLAVERGDAAAVRTALAAGGISWSRIESAVLATPSHEVREMLIAHDRRALDVALGRALFRASPSANADEHEAAAVLKAGLAAGETIEAIEARLVAERAFRLHQLVRRHGRALDVDAWVADATSLVARSIAKHRRLEPALAPLILHGHTALALELIGRRDLPKIDVRWTDAHGATLLHAAASAPSAEVATVLLGRGADRDAKDARGATPLDRAKHAWNGPRRDEASKVITLLTPRAPSVPPAGSAPSAPPPIGPGDRVRHAKFGEGDVVSAADGKLTIRFADATRTLLLRFVERV